MTVKPLPRSLAPQAEESLPGFLLRLAYRLRQPPARIADLVGLGHGQQRLPLGLLFALPPDRADAFAHATRMTLQGAHDLTLARFAPAYPPLAQPRQRDSRTVYADRRSWAVLASSRYCPACLAGSDEVAPGGGVWKTGWHLPIVIACTAHGRVLRWRCPECGNQPGVPSDTERPGLILQRRTAGLHPAQCRHPGAATRCGTWLDRAPGREPVATVDEALLLTLQGRIESALSPAPGEQPRLRFPDLIAAAHLIRLSWPRSSAHVGSDGLAALLDDHIGRSRTSPARSALAWTPPEDPVVCGALLHAADRLLGDGDPDGLRERVQPLASVLSGADPGTAASFRRLRFSEDFARALARRVNGFHVAGGHASRRLRPPSRTSRFTVRHVPALIPVDWFDEHFSAVALALPQHATRSDRHLRRTASLLLAELAAGGTWPDSAHALSLPWSTAQQSLRVTDRRLAPLGLWPDFQHAVTAVAQHLDATAEPVDFAARRTALGDWELTESVWAELVGDLSRLRTGATSPTRAAGSALIWAHITQGDYLHCPVVQRMRADGRPTATLIATINQLRSVRGLGSSSARRILLNRLTAFGDQLAGDIDAMGAAQPPA